jgi:hypothetical protein
MLRLRRPPPHSIAQPQPHTPQPQQAFADAGQLLPPASALHPPHRTDACCCLALLQRSSFKQATNLLLPLPGPSCSVAALRPRGTPAHTTTQIGTHVHNNNAASQNT